MLAGGYVDHHPSWLHGVLLGIDERVHVVLLKFRSTLIPRLRAAAKTASSRATLSGLKLGGAPGGLGSVSRLGHGTVKRMIWPPAALTAAISAVTRGIASGMSSC